VSQRQNNLQVNISIYFHETKTKTLVNRPSVENIYFMDSSGEISGVTLPTPGEMRELSIDSVDLLLFLPTNWSPNEMHPVILFLHGMGAVKKIGKLRETSLPAILLGAHEDIPFGGREGFPFVVVMPLAQQRDWKPQFDLLVSLVDTLMPVVRGDTAATYCCGNSMGGKGSWELASRNPGKFAAIVPICGYLVDHKKLDKRDAPSSLKEVVEGCKDLPVWAFHSITDRLVGVEHSDEVVKALREADGSGGVNYTRYESAPNLPNFPEKGFGHACYELTFRDDELYSWLLSKRKE
jgi:predicted peptidase